MTTSLLVAGVGLVGTVLGAVLAATWAERRDKRQWHRERQRQHDVWSREDRQRTFDQRREAYVDFHEKLRSAELAINKMAGRPGPAAADDWQQALADSLARLQLFAASPIAKLASDAYYATIWWVAEMQQPGSLGEDFPFRPGEREYNTAVAAYLSAVRRDLGVELATPPGVESASEVDDQ